MAEGALLAHDLDRIVRSDPGGASSSGRRHVCPAGRLVGLDVRGRDGHLAALGLQIRHDGPDLLLVHGAVEGGHDRGVVVDQMVDRQGQGLI